MYEYLTDISTQRVRVMLIPGQRAPSVVLSAYQIIMKTKKYFQTLTLYLSVGVSEAGGVEVEANRGGRGGFSSSPSNNKIKESQHEKKKRVRCEFIHTSLAIT